MKRIPALFAFAVLLLIIVEGCKKETETLATPELSDYYPLQIGKTYIYRLDSTLPAAFGSYLGVKSYQAKDSVESTFTDNSGRLSYRIYRYTRDTLGTGPWEFASTYFVTPSREKVELVENNLRFIKLQLPVSENYTWKGNAYIETTDINSPVTYFDNWDYGYANIDMPSDVLNTTYDSTITILQHDETSPDVPYDPSLPIQIKLYSVEVYAKGIGLVYKDFLYWTWQTDPPPAKFVDESYGVKLQLISHN